MKKTWWNLDHHVWHQLKEYHLEKSKVLVALSGGEDSLALACSMQKVLGKDRVGIAHFHHGGASEYRRRAQEFCQKWAQDQGLRFFTSEWSQEPLKSEAQFREKRYEFLLNLREQEGFQVVATGHQMNDVLETRLLRLIRGTGPQGLRAIEVLRPPFFRPLLQVSRKQIRVYLSKENLKALTDPSNFDNNPLRNWLRNQWLPQLEEKRPGSHESLGRSLEALVQSLSIDITNEPKDLISRSEFLAQTEGQQIRWLARALLHTGQKNFTQFHLREIRRRVIQSPKSNSFQVAGCEWVVNAQQIRVQPSR